ncbi:MAG: FecR family protein [Verrucomicrobiota bacterium]
MIDRERIEDLADRLLAEGELEPGEATELRAALAQSKEARAIYLTRCEIHFALGEAATLGVLSEPEPAAPNVPAPQLRVVSQPVPPKRRASVPNRAATAPGHGARSWRAIAALVVIGLGVWSFFQLSESTTDSRPQIVETPQSQPGNPVPQPPDHAPRELEPEVKPVVAEEDEMPEPPRTTPEPEPAAETMVATQSETPNTELAPQEGETARENVGAVVRVVGGDSSWQIGEKVSAGEVEVIGRRVEFELGKGVRVAAVGPTVLDFTSPERVRLVSGRLMADVPEGAEGFRVDAGDVSVVDLGTRFAVTLDEEGGVTSVHVYDGRVAAGMPGYADQGTRNLSTGATVRLNPSTKRLDNVRFVASDFVSPPSKISSIDWYSPEILELDPPPKVVSQDSHGDQAIVFRESAEVRLPRDLPVDLVAPGAGGGSESGAINQGGSIPRGRRVSSYLVSFWSDGANKMGGAAEIRFSRPILGVIAETERLRASDRDFRSRAVDNQMADENFRGVTPRSLRSGQEVIEILPDGQSIRVRMQSATGLGDQLRILVADD